MMYGFLFIYFVFLNFQVLGFIEYRFKMKLVGYKSLREANPCIFLIQQISKRSGSARMSNFGICKSKYKTGK